MKYSKRSKVECLINNGDFMRWFSFLLLFVCTVSFAGFGGARSSGGGGRSSGSSFGGSRSSSGSFGSYRSSPSVPSRSSTFGGSRSSGGPATIIRPSKPAPPIQQQPSNNVNEVHHYHHDDGGSSFWNGMMWGSLMNRPQTVVVNPGVPTDGGTVVYNSGHGFFFYLFVAVVMVIIGYVCFLALKGE